MRDIEREAPRVGVLVHMDQPAAPPPPQPPQNIVVNVGQARQGCGCLSGCGTALAIFWFFGLASSALAWVDEHQGTLLVAVAVAILVSSPLILWAHRRALGKAT